MAVDREKLAKVLRLTASGNDGEALAALRAAQRMMAKAGMTWDDLLSSKPPAAPWQSFRADGWSSASFAEEVFRNRAAAAEHASRSARADAALVASGLEVLEAAPGLLTEWERAFLSDWKAKRSTAMSGKQRAVFDRIIAKFQAKQAAKETAHG